MTSFPAVVHQRGLVETVIFDPIMESQQNGVSSASYHELPTPVHRGPLRSIIESKEVWASASYTRIPGTPVAGLAGSYGSSCPSDPRHWVTVRHFLSCPEYRVPAEGRPRLILPTPKQKNPGQPIKMYTLSLILGQPASIDNLPDCGFKDNSIHEKEYSQSVNDYLDDRLGVTLYNY